MKGKGKKKVQRSTFNWRSAARSIIKGWALNIEHWALLSLQHHRLAFGHYQDVIMDAGLFCAGEQAGQRLI